MKRLTVLSMLLVMVLGMNLFAKSSYKSKVIYPDKGGSASELFNAKKIVWVGIDVRRLKCVGPQKAFIDPSLSDETDTDKIIMTIDAKKWNEQISTPDSMNTLKQLFSDKEITVDIDAMSKINERSGMKECLSPSDQTVTVSVEDIKTLIRSYSTSDKDGVGVAVIAKKFDKLNHMADMIFVFFNLQTKELILAADVSSKPTWGVSVYTFWFDSIKYATKKIRGDLSDWKDDYGK